MKINANYDPEKKTITDQNGREWPVYFELSEEDRKRVDDAVENLRAVCLELCVPHLVLVEPSYQEKTHGSILAIHAPGARQSRQFALAVRLAELVSEGSPNIDEIVAMSLVAKILAKLESDKLSK